MKLSEFQATMELLQRKSVNGCGNHGCCIMKPRGQGTNGGCSCGPRPLARYLRLVAAELEKQPQWESENGNHGS